VPGANNIGSPLLWKHSQGCQIPRACLRRSSPFFGRERFVTPMLVIPSALAVAASVLALAISFDLWPAPRLRRLSVIAGVLHREIHGSAGLARGASLAWPAPLPSPRAQADTSLLGHGASDPALQLQPWLDGQCRAAFFSASRPSSSTIQMLALFIAIPSGSVSRRGFRCAGRAAPPSARSVQFSTRPTGCRRRSARCRRHDMFGSARQGIITP